MRTSICIFDMFNFIHCLTPYSIIAKLYSERSILMNINIETDMKSTNTALRALSNEHRLRIMSWIMNPEVNFPPQEDGDLVQDGVCVGFITEKIGLSQPTVTSHMKILADAGLVSSKQIKNWVFYKPQSERLKAAISALQNMLE